MFLNKESNSEFIDMYSSHYIWDLQKNGHLTDTKNKQKEC